MNALRGTYYMVQESLLLSLAHHLSQCSTDSNGLRGEQGIDGKIKDGHDGAPFFTSFHYFCATKAKRDRRRSLASVYTTDKNRCVFSNSASPSSSISSSRRLARASYPRFGTTELLYVTSSVCTKAKPASWISRSSSPGVVKRK